MIFILQLSIFSRLGVVGYLTQHESALILNKNQLDVQLYLWVNIEVLSTDNIFLLCLWIIQQPAISHYKEPGNTQTRHFNMNLKWFNLLHHVSFPRCKTDLENLYQTSVTIPAKQIEGWTPKCTYYLFIQQHLEPFCFHH